MKSVLLLALVTVATAARLQFGEEWNLWKSQHGKHYDSGEVCSHDQMVNMLGYHGRTTMK